MKTPIYFRAVLLLLLASSSAAVAQGDPPQTGNFCVRDFRSGANCVANDVGVESLTPVATTEQCNEGTIGFATVQFEANLIAGMADRYDIGIFLARDGGSARDGDDCFHDYLDPPVTAIPMYGNVDMDTVPDLVDGPWWDGDSDTCGDIEGSTEVFKTLDSVVIACVDSNGDGNVDVDICLSWDNNAGTACNGVAQAFPGTNSKCGCSDPRIEIPNTPVVPPAMPVIGVAKQAGAVSDVGGGVFETAITLTLENLGNVALSSVQVTDNLATTFPAPATFSVTSGPAGTGTLSANAGFNGSGDTTLLVAGSSTLPVGATETVSFTVRFSPNGAMGPFNNTALASGSPPTGAPVSDTSDDGTDPDPNGNGNPDESGENDPTPIVPPAMPVIGVAKQAGAVSDVGGGAFETAITLTLENLGNVALSSVQVTDNLATTFPAPATFSVTSGPAGTGTLSANAGFNGSGDTTLLVAGSSTLPVGATETVSFTVRFSPNGAMGPFNNTALASGSPPTGAPVSDTSDDGTDPDPNGNGNPDESGENDPTPIVPPVVPPAMPVIGVAKQAGAVSDVGGGAFETAITLTLENLGNVALSSVQVTDNLATTFPAPATFSVTSGPAGTGTLSANAGFNGSGDTTLLVAGSSTLPVGATETVSFTVRFSPNGAMGPFNNTALASGSPPTGAPVSDTSDDGTDPDPNGNGNPDESGENDPTPIVPPVVPPAMPVIGVAKQAGAVSDVGGGAFETAITLTLENLGNVALSSVQVTDNLATTFPAPATFSVTSGPAGTGTLSANAGFNGSGDTTLLVAGSSTLPVGATETVSFTVRFSPNGAMGPFNNTALASGSPPTGAPVSDTSDDGTDPDPNGNGNPDESGENDPTPIVPPVVPPAMPVIGVAKQAGAVSDVGGGAFETAITLTLENLGNVALSSVQVTDNLATTFPAPATFSVTSGPAGTGTLSANAGFNGSGDTTLLVAGSSTLPVGATETVSFTVRFSPNGAMGPFNNTALASGSPPRGAPVSDTSDDGTDPDPNGNGNPDESGENDPTPISAAPVLVPSLGGWALLLLAMGLVVTGAWRLGQRRRPSPGSS